MFSRASFSKAPFSKQQDIGIIKKILIATCNVASNIFRKISLTKLSSVKLISNRNSVVIRKLSGVANVSSVFIKNIGKKCIARVSALGSIIQSKQLSKILLASINATGSILRASVFFKILTATVTIVGNIRRSINKTLLVNVLANINIPRQIFLTKLSTINSTGIIKRISHKIFVANIEIISNISKNLYKIFVSA